jgi:photosystem II stability/assembly factor-like uncharacterized protein
MKKIPLLLFILSLAFTSHSQTWQRFQNPDGGSVIDMVSKGDTMYAALSGGVFKSADHAATWTECSNGIPTISTSCLLVKNNRLLVGTDSGVYVSDDDGASWTLSSAGMLLWGGLPNVYKFVQHGTDTILALARSGTQLFYSTNSGNSWNLLYGMSMYGMEQHSIMSYQGKIYWSQPFGSASNLNGIKVSNNGGVSYVSYNQGLDDYKTGGLLPPIYSTGRIGRTMLTAFQLSTAPYRTVVARRDLDTGTQWHITDTISQALMPRGPWKIFSHQGVFYMGCSFGQDTVGVVMSADTGSTWTSMSLAYSSGALSYFHDGTDLLVGTYGNGLFAHHNGTWEDRSTGFNVSSGDMSSVKRDELGNMWFAGSKTGVFKLNSATDTWDRTDSGFAPDITGHLIRRRNELGFSQLRFINGKLRTSAADNSGLFRSYFYSNTSNTWIPDISPAILECAIGDTLFGLDYDTTSWEPVVCYREPADTLWHNPGTFPAIGALYGIFAYNIYSEENSNVLIVSTDGGGILRSTDRGTSWDFANTGLGDSSHRFISDIEFVYNTAFNRYDFLMATDTGLFKSEDEGLTWNLIWSHPGNATDQIEVYGTYIFITSRPPFYTTVYPGSSTVFASSDYGATWIDLKGNIPLVFRKHVTINAIAVDYMNNRLIASTNYMGVWHVSLNGIFSLPMPVSFNGFDGEVKRSADAQLNWQTASEINNKAFHVMRSSDGKRFEPIATASPAYAANYTGTSVYTFTDYGVFNSAKKDAYYFIEQEDYDGKKSRTNTILLSIDADRNMENDKVSVYPNPATAEITFNLAGLNTSASVTIELYNSQGKMVLSKQTSLSAVKLDVSMLERGLYLYKTKSGRNTSAGKIMLK